MPPCLLALVQAHSTALWNFQLIPLLRRSTPLDTLHCAAQPDTNKPRNSSTSQRTVTSFERLPRLGAAWTASHGSTHCHWYPFYRHTTANPRGAGLLENQVRRTLLRDPTHGQIPLPRSTEDTHFVV
ncbi:hypothetical protein QC764_0024600 [Podospora pseudoanserina]|uniref:Secreted protein n=1 Tax=Podospora pseudoanserina TaxID=2609844 RepID=A0ABR0IRD7_9PEZI|nr:hypothetical protein QC764_0024600 [Podospora pseudoanserina]